MKALVACSEAARLDAATAARAEIDPLLLMEDASVEIWRRLEPIARERGAGDSGLLLALCGTGNNGGDALAVVRHARFSGLARVAVILTKGSLGELGSMYAASLRALGVPLLAWGEARPACEALISEAALILDGLTGSGLAGAAREGLAALIAAAGASGKPIASIDLPSGLSDSFEEGHPLIPATWTLSIEPRKACLYFPLARESCGEILPISGIFPVDEPIASRTTLLEAADLPALAPLPPDSAYKGERGRVAIFAGSVGASGAAVLASRSCLAAGAGLAALFASSELFPIVAPMLDAVMVKHEPGEGAFDPGRWDSLLIGPGWGRTGSRLECLASLLGSGLPAVLDADAIGLYRALVERGFSAPSPLILTPHPGEFAALAGRDSGLALANPTALLPELAGALKAVIVLKSHVTWIAAPGGELSVWEGRESGLGTAGSGDVLAGLAGGLLARAVSKAKVSGARTTDSEACDAAKAAVIAHGLAGRRARSERGWFEAGEIIVEAGRILGRETHPRSATDSG